MVCSKLALCCAVLCCAVVVPVQRAVGVVNVTLMQASDSISAAICCKPGTPFAMITNMAVTPEMRRRGIAHQLMQVSQLAMGWYAHHDLSWHAAVRVRSSMVT